MSFETSVVVPHEQPITPAYAVRSTMLQSSLTFLREKGYFERYCALIEPQHRATIVESLAPIWMPIEVGLAHYAACDALNLSAAEQKAIGESVGTRLQGTLLSSFMRGARESGIATPMFYLGRADRLYKRLIQGGSPQVKRTGPKDVEIELQGVRLTRSAYFRAAFLGMARASLAFFGASGFTKQLAFDAASDRFVISIAWV